MQTLVKRRPSSVAGIFTPMERPKHGTVAFAEFIYSGNKHPDKVGEKITTMCFSIDGKIMINATNEFIEWDKITKWTVI